MIDGNVNAWLVAERASSKLNSFDLAIRHERTSPLPEIGEGDFILIVDENDRLQAISRVYRVRKTTKSTTVYFDAIERIENGEPVENYGLAPLPEGAVMARVAWDEANEACWKALGKGLVDLRPIEGKDVHERAYIRKLLELAVMDDLLGPAMGPHEEVVGMSVRDRYLLGKLAPRKLVEVEPVEDGEGESGVADADDSTKESVEYADQSLVPSSFGFTFCVDGDADRIEVEAEWGRYERTESEEKVDEKTEKPLRCWKRIPSGGTVTLELREGRVEPLTLDADAEKVRLEGTVSERLPNGDRLVTLFLRNEQEEPDENRDVAWVFQPKIVVRHPDGEAIFRKRPVLENGGFDEERETLEMLYRDRVEFAIGHGMSVHATPLPDDPERATSVETVVMPSQEIPVTETPGLREEDRPAMREMVEKGLLDMERLAEMGVEELREALSTLTRDYAAWIEENEARIDSELAGYEASARESLARCRDILRRLEEGIETLTSDGKALEAFRFANRAMAEQRIHSIYTLRRRRGEEPTLDELRVPKNRSWRAFQLAFILLSVPALADPTHRDRTEPLAAYADLLWFPTGGGKTEAYLGVAAFTMAIRRLQGTMGSHDATRGLAVIMRYTLRLLTIQQFQRATTLICAMEVERRKDPGKWGEEPFRIGLWVGQRVTPNTTEEAYKAIQELRTKKYASGSSPAQLTSCPWCGSEIAPGRDIDVDRERNLTVLYCGDPRGRCDFSRTRSPDLGVPVGVVDEELYRRPPSMMIATVDKFAQMAWKGEVRTLFGRVLKECPRHGLVGPDTLECPDSHKKKERLEATKTREIAPIRPPDLIVQDEFHLISGPLGTMVGLYETAVDDLCGWEMDGVKVRPKIVASTATVRKADEQIKNVFLRSVSVFPPSGVDIGDNFFSVQRSVESVPGRRYVGVFAPGSSRPAVLIRVYVAVLTASRYLAECFGPAADPYMTTVGYFNSLRELGGMRRLAEDDVQTRAYKVQMDRNTDRPHLVQRKIMVIEELTSRVSSEEIPKKLDLMEKPFALKWNAEERRYDTVWKKGEAKAVDVVLATNMLSVGVDVDRIGLMVVNGQPKNTAEYIQATSRVGRSYPGVVFTVLTWSRPRDLSHYETFEHYHACFYKHVEAQSVTPFAPRAMDRGLTGTMVSMARMRYDELAPNEGASKLTRSDDPRIVAVKETLVHRAENVRNPETGKLAEAMVQARVDIWTKEARELARTLGYDTRHGKGTVAALLKRPGVETWNERTVPTSMREVEPGVRLILEERRLDEETMPKWKMRKKEENDG
ncbi:DISARM system helicase DrmA [Hydrogenimonas sp.]